MSDPLSIAASIIGIATTGFEVARGLYSIADVIGSAGREVRTYAAEIDLFSRVLKQTREQLQNLGNVSPDTQNLLKDVVDICGRIVGILDRLNVTLYPLLDRFKDSPRKLSQFGLRLQWIFSKKGKLLFYRDALSHQQCILGTLMDVIMLQITTDRSGPHITLMHISLASSITTVQQSLRVPGVFTNNQIDYLAVPSPRVISSSAASTYSETGNQLAEEQAESSDAARQDISEPKVDVGSDTLDEDPGKSEGDASSSAGPAAQTEPTPPDSITSLVLMSSHATEEGLSPEDIASIDGEIEKELDPDAQMTAGEIWEDMRVVSRKVLRLADDILRSSQDGSLPIPAREDQREESRVPTPEPSSQGAAHMSDDRGNAPFTSSSIEAPTASTISIPQIRETSETKSNELVLLYDSWSNSYHYPYEECRTWERICKVARELPVPEEIRNRYREHDYAAALGNNKFRWRGPDNRIILTRVWSQILQPGWTIRLEFEDERLNDGHSRQLEQKLKASRLGETSKPAETSKEPQETVEGGKMDRLKRLLQRH